MYRLCTVLVCSLTQHRSFCRHVSDPLTLSTPPQILLPGSHHTVVYFYMFCLFICCFLFHITLISEFIWFLSFSVPFILLSMLLSRSIHDVTNGGISSFLMAEQYSTVYVYHFFSQSSTEGHVGCFHVLATMNNTVINIGVRTRSVQKKPSHC